MADDKNNIEVEPTTKPPLTEMVVASNRGLVLRDFDQMWRFASCVRQSGLAPKGLEKTEQIIIALETGLEVGLPPMQALQGIAVINNKATIMGDTAMALVLASGLLKSKKESYEGTAGTDDYTAVFTTKRKEAVEEKTSRFSILDAKTAKLWGKAGPWTQYPTRMLMYRAKGFNFRDHWPDVLKGLHLYEEFVGHVPLANGAAELATREERAALPQEAEAPDEPTSEPIARVVEKMLALMADAIGGEAIPPKLLQADMADLASRVAGGDPADYEDSDAWTDELAEKCIKEMETNGLDPRWLPGIREGVPTAAEMAGQQKLPLEE